MFQPATKAEVACIVHFHLLNPIMVSAPTLTCGSSAKPAFSPFALGLQILMC